MILNAARLSEIASGIEKTSVAVIGDLMLDVYYWGLVERISPEAPVPVVRVERTDARVGGAANVAYNLVSLGCRAPLVGVVGTVSAQDRLMDLMGKLGIEKKYLVEDRSRNTTEKIRVVAHNQQVVRADFETDGKIGAEILEKLLEAADEALRNSDAVIISDYGKGVVNENLMDHVRKGCEDAGIPILVDPKEGHFSLYRGAYAVTPNKAEAGGFYGRRIRTEEDLAEVGNSLLSDLDARAILLTRGEDGMTLFQKGRKPENFPTLASEVYDVTGAGDTVISVLAASVAAGATLEEGIELANVAAGIVVRELGTASVTIEEVSAYFDS